MLAVGALVLAALLASAAWFLPRVPPNCTDARTLALVQQALLGHFGLPPSTTLTNIRTVAGGILALRFVCHADLMGFDRASLPPGPVPRAVDYSSELGDGRQRVTTAIAPALTWQRVE